MESNQIYISYAWKDREQNIEESREQIVNEICNTFEKKGFKITRDKSHLTYKDSIKDFMQEIGKGKFVLVIVSQKYLQSEYCMYEAVEVYKHGDFKKRVFPIVLNDANIFDFVEQVKLVKYWEEKAKEYNDLAKTIETQTSKIKLLERVKDCEEIARNMENFISIVSDMNVLTPDIHIEQNFSPLINSIETKINEYSQELEITNSEKTENPKKQEYIIGNVRKLLNNAFSDDSFNDFCMDNYENVYKQFSSGQSKNQKVRLLVEYVHSNMIIGELLEFVKSENLNQYKTFEPYKQ